MLSLSDYQLCPRLLSESVSISDIFSFSKLAAWRVDFEMAVLVPSAMLARAPRSKIQRYLENTGTTARTGKMYNIKFHIRGHYLLFKLPAKNTRAQLKKYTYIYIYISIHISGKLFRLDSLTVKTTYVALQLVNGNTC